MKLFQIEEPDGSPSDASAPGAAIGISVAGAQAEVAFAVGGNAVVLDDRDGFALDLAVPAADAPPAEWQALFEGARLRAERALGRPVTHAVVALAAPADPVRPSSTAQGAARAALDLLLLVAASDLKGGDTPAVAAAILAEDLAPRPETP